MARVKYNSGKGSPPRGGKGPRRYPSRLPPAPTEPEESVAEESGSDRPKAKKRKTKHADPSTANDSTGGFDEGIYRPIFPLGLQEPEKSNAKEIGSNRPKGKKKVKTEDADSKAPDNSTEQIGKGFHRFNDLPPELRREVLAAAVTETRNVDFRFIDIPALAHVSRQLRHEVMPVLFASNDFQCLVTTSWCYKRLAFHNDGLYLTGQISMSPHDVFWARIKPTIQESDVRFRSVRIEVVYACCRHDEYRTPVGSCLLSIDGMTPTSRFIFETNEAETRRVFNLMHEEAQRVIRQFAERERFNGYTLRDVKDVARCFRRI